MTTKKTYKFGKAVDFNGKVIEMNVVVEDGINVKGNSLRSVVDDGSVEIYEAAKKFENFDISVDELISVILKKGYIQL